MALSVGTNNAAISASSSISSVGRDMEKSYANLASGKRINAASDDAAGVAISSRLSTEIRGVNQAIRNAIDGQSLVDTVEGAHKEIEQVLQRMREVSVQYANDTNNEIDRYNLALELGSLLDEINRISDMTTWAGQTLMDGETSFNLQIGSGNSDGNSIKLNIPSVSTIELGLTEEIMVLPEGVVEEVITAEDGINTPNTIEVPGTFFGNFDTAGDQDWASVELVVGQQYGISAMGIGDNAVGDTYLYVYDEDGTLIAQDDDGWSSLGLAQDIGDDNFAPTSNLAEWASAGVLTSEGYFPEQNGYYNSYLTLEPTYTGTHFLEAASYSGSYSGDYRIDIIEGPMDSNFFPSSGTAPVAHPLSDEEKATNPSQGLADNILASITKIDTAISKINTQRSGLGAFSNRLNHTIKNLTNISTNLSVAKSGIEDADFALETMRLAKAQILQQASTAMLAQSNASTQNVLSLF
jgi:flagellin